MTPQTLSTPDSPPDILPAPHSFFFLLNYKVIFANHLCLLLLFRNWSLQTWRPSSTASILLLLPKWPQWTLCLCAVKAFLETVWTAKKTCPCPEMYWRKRTFCCIYAQTWYVFLVLAIFLSTAEFVNACICKYIPLKQKGFISTLAQRSLWRFLVLLYGSKIFICLLSLIFS